jgi:glycosyltransferase (activator-dependent family)
MRVLFTTYADRSVFHPMAPVAWALAAAGHEVRVACQPALTEVVTHAGLCAVPVGRDSGFWRLTGRDPEARESLRPGLPAPYHAAVATEPADVASMRDGYTRLIGQWHKLDNFPMIAALIDFAQAWQPDLIVWEPTTYAGAIAARACGAASARLLWSIDVFGATRRRYLRLCAGRVEDPMADWLAPYARRFGGEFEEDMVTGHFTIDPLPPSLALDAGLRCVRMRHVPYGGPAVVPPWLRVPPERPRVALTLGTTATDNFAGYATSVQDILDAVADLDVELVATLAAGERQRLRRIPANTRIESYVPLDALAPTCAAVVNHAGPGTLLTTALHAVPQLTLPHDFDEPELARRAAAQGSALNVPADRATGATLGAALLRLLTEPGFRAAAERLRQEMRDQPAPSDIVHDLEELTTKHRRPTV